MYRRRWRPQTVAGLIACGKLRACYIGSPRFSLRALRGGAAASLLIALALPLPGLARTAPELTPPGRTRPAPWHSGPLPHPFDLATLNGSNGFQLNGRNPSDESGTSVSGVGDVNGDGRGDLLIGAPLAAPDENFFAGESYVVFGQSSFPPSLELSDLDGTNGFRLDGIDPGDNAGRAVSGLGDVNGDGFDDLLVGAYGADVGAEESAGEAYVVFGRATFPASLNLSTLNGTNGFRLSGTNEYDQVGFAVSAAGDINGDSMADLVVGAYGADSYAGEVYVVFGRASFPANLTLGALNGGDGFRLDGTDSYDDAGYSVSGAGDVNGDGRDDLILGAPYADPNGASAAGESYVIFGRATFPASLSLSALDGTNGFRLDGIAPSDESGTSVSGAGDVNGDGLDDLLIGAPLANPNANAFAGESYVVFGRTNFPVSLSLGTLDGTNGFRLPGVAADDQAGHAVSGIGDVNADGVADLLIGAPGTDPDGVADAGAGYVVFGRGSFPATLPLSTLDGTNGFRLDGIAAYDRAGTSVSRAGDINGDGGADLLLGAPDASPGGREFAGQSYVVFGQVTAPTALTLDTLVAAPAGATHDWGRLALPAAVLAALGTLRRRLWH